MRFLKFIKIFAVILVCLSLSSCKTLTDYNEPEQVILVSAIGFDAKDGVLVMSAETPSKSSNDESVIIKGSGKTADECIKNINRSVGSNIMLSHCGIAVLGESLSYNDSKEILFFLFSCQDFPLASRITASINAESLLNCNSLSGEPIGYDILRFLKNMEEENEEFASQLYVVMRKDDIALPYFTVDANDNYRLRESLWKII